MEETGCAGKHRTAGQAAEEDVHREPITELYNI